MNSPEAAAPKTSNMRFVLPLFLVIILIAAVGYIITTQTGIDKKMVEVAVKNWEAQVENFAKSQGTSLDFTYDSIEMKGQGAGRHAIIINPTFTLHEKAPEPVEGAAGLTKESERNINDTMRFTTAKVELIPQSMSLDHILIRASDPITFDYDHGLKGRITADSAIELDVEKLEENKQQFLHSVIALPTQLNIESLAGDDVKDKLTVISDKGGKLDVKTDYITHELVALESDLTNVKVNDLKGESLLSVARIDILTNNVKQADGNYKVKVVGDLKDVMTNEQDMPYGAFSAAIDMAYNGPMPDEGDQNFDWSTAKAAFVLNRLELGAKDTSLQATADFKTTEGELLPVGKANIKIINLKFIRDELEKQGVLDKESDMLLSALVLKITDQKMKDLKDLSIDISREAKGSLKVGKSNFEDLFAIVLTGGALAPKDPQSAPLTTTVPDGAPLPSPAPVSPSAQ